VIQETLPGGADQGRSPARGEGGRVGCLMVARLPVACEVADRPELWHRPVAVAHPDAAVVWSASPAALAEGVQEGQRLSEAVGRCPTLVVLAARPARYEALDATMLDAVEQVVPGVEPAGLGMAYVDLSGAVRHHGSAERLHRALLACAPPELRPRLGVGPTKFVALLAAQTTRAEPELTGGAHPTRRAEGPATDARARAEPELTGGAEDVLPLRSASGAAVGPGPQATGPVSGRAEDVRPPHDVTVVGPGEVSAFLEPAPVEALPVPGEVVRRLRLVGLTTVGEVARLPRRALVAQFGREGERLAGLLWDRAAEPVRPRPRLERLRERLSLPEPLVSREAVRSATRHVLDRVLRHPCRGERVARQVVVRAETEQGQRWESTVTLRTPRGDHDGIWVALGPVVERATLPGPVSELSVELRGLREAQGWQGELLDSDHPDRPGRAQRRERVEEGMRQLRARYGRCMVGRMAPVESWNRIPERQWALVELD
jgi:nucleotidyltransferase/DNA polymerase involved in DNA repair